MMELIDEFLAVLRESLDMLHNNDQYLINYEADEPVKNDEHVSELSISHKLGHYLELFVTGYHVDCEYNRNLADKKSMGESRIRPDIIIHKRGSNEKNFVVIEIKPWWNRDDVIKDEAKLAYLTNQDNEFKYKYGLSLLIEQSRVGDKAKIFENGKAQGDYIKV